MHVDPYLNFNGRCEEALDFYKSAVNAEVTMLMRFKDAPPGSCAPGHENKIMHAALRIGSSSVMASDGQCTGSTRFEGINLTLSVASDAEAAQRFSALSAGGKVTMPLAKTFFSSNFGMCFDKFGIMWMVIVTPA
jgi:PhnB protein